VNLYQDALLDHYRNPRNRGVLQNADFQSGEDNPSCGDSINIYGQVQDGRLTAVSFQGAGCVISQAAASMLTQKALGMNLNDIMKLDTHFMRQLVGIELGPTRVRCALLALEALHKGIQEYLNAQ
jgi:nitrogen fixation protein NifU and related proteins